MRSRLSLVLIGFAALSAPALAAEAEPRAIANAYSIMLEHQFFAWHIWTTGVSRLDDGTLFGLCSIVLAMAFGVSGLGIILFKENGLRFRGGWLVSTPAIVGSMILYSTLRPYPSAQDVIPMLLFSGLGGIAALVVGRLAKGSVKQAVDHPVRKGAAHRSIDDRRIKMATRAPSAAKRV